MKNLATLNYFLATALVTIVMLLIYATLQQVYRTGLDDPQIQMVRDISSKLAQRRSVETLIVADSTDITHSLSPFIVLYDVHGKAIRSNALLNGKMPQIPEGIIEVVRKKGEHRVSWQPGKGIRMAMVILQTKGTPVQFIASGRSMAEVEERILRMRKTVFIAWVICLVFISITAILNLIIWPGKVLQKTIQ